MRRKLRKIEVWVIIFIFLNVLVSAIIVESYSTVVPEQIYVEEPPQEILDYLESKTCFGRVLPIDSPYWVYSLSHYTGKPLIDGWYPQGSILKTVKPVEKTINSSGNETLFLHLIDKAEDYGIKWVLLGNRSRLDLFEETTFRPVMSNAQFTLLENIVDVSYIETEPSANLSWHQETDAIIITIRTSSPITTVKVKEAYFPGWYASDNGYDINLSQDEYGFMMFTVKGEGNHDVKLWFRSYSGIPIVN